MAHAGCSQIRSMLWHNNCRWLRLLCTTHAGITLCQARQTACHALVHVAVAVAPLQHSSTLERQSAMTLAGCLAAQPTFAVSNIFTVRTVARGQQHRARAHAAPAAAADENSGM
jgi:hypothetical protein